jgi:hypothetical protein
MHQCHDSDLVWATWTFTVSFAWCTCAFSAGDDAIIRWAPGDSETESKFDVARVLALVEQRHIDKEERRHDLSNVLMLLQWYVPQADVAHYSPDAVHYTEGAICGVCATCTLHLQHVWPLLTVDVQPIQCCYGLAHVFRVPSDNSDDLVFIRDTGYECLQGID